MGFLPVCREDMQARGWDAPDFVLVTGDAYVDHPSFGTAVISRVLEAAGLSCGGSAAARLARLCAVHRVRPSAAGLSRQRGQCRFDGCALYGGEKRRSNDWYSAGGKAGKRPTAL